MMAGKLEIDLETAERICLLSLKDHKKWLKKELKAHKLGSYMHPEDVVYNTKLIEALDVVIHYYGG